MIQTKAGCFDAKRIDTTPNKTTTFFKNMLIGGLAGIISRTATSPLELYKIQLQNKYLKESTISNVVKKEGIRHLWKGNSTNCIRVFPQFAINYGVYSKCKQQFYYLPDGKLVNFVCGGFAGLTSTAMVYPLETVRTRLALQMNKSHYTTPLDVFKKLNLFELYGGLSVSLVGFTTFSAFNFMFYNVYSDYFNSLDLNSSVSKLLSGGFSGITALSITYPTDLLRRRFQMSGFSENIPKYNGMIDGFNTIIKTDGIPGLYRGIGVAYIRIFPCLALQFWCLEKGKDLLL